MTDPRDPALPLHAKGAVSDELQSILVDLLDLARQAAKIAGVAARSPDAPT